MNFSTDDYGCMMEEVFENERLLGSTLPLITGDLDSCFSSKGLLGNDPLNWSVANGQECRFDCKDAKRSPPVNPVPEGYVELCTWFVPKGWVYKKDFTSHALFSKYQLGSEVRYRVWQRVLVLEEKKEAFLRDYRLDGDQQKSATAIPPYKQFAYNIESISKALAVHAKSDSIQYRLQLVREYRTIRRKTIKTFGLARSGLEAFVSAGTDTLMEGLGGIGRSASQATGITAGLTNLTNAESVSQMDDEVSEEPVWKYLRPLPHGHGDDSEKWMTLPLAPDMLALPSSNWTYVRGFNYWIDDSTDDAGWQYGASIDDTLTSTDGKDDVKWSSSYDPRRKVLAHRIKRRTWCRVLCTPKDSLTVTTFQQLLHSYHLRNPRETIKTTDQYKLGHYVKNWKKRKFVITHSKLEFWKGDHVKGYVPLVGRESVTVYNGEKYPCPSSFGFLIRDPVHQKYHKNFWDWFNRSRNFIDPRDKTIEHDLCYHPSWISNIRNSVYTRGVPRYCLVVDGNTAEQREELIDILSHHLWIIGGEKVLGSGDDLLTSPIYAAVMSGTNQTRVNERLPYSTSMSHGKHTAGDSHHSNASIDDLLTSAFSPMQPSTSADSPSRNANRTSDMELNSRPASSLPIPIRGVNTQSVDSQQYHCAAPTASNDAHYYTGLTCLKKNHGELSFKTRFIWIGISSVANQSARFYWAKGSSQKLKAQAKFISISKIERIEQVKAGSYFGGKSLFRRKTPTESHTQMTSGSIIVLQLPTTITSAQIILQLADAQEALGWVREIRKYMQEAPSSYNSVR